MSERFEQFTIPNRKSGPLFYVFPGCFAKISSRKLLSVQQPRRSNDRVTNVTEGCPPASWHRLPVSGTASPCRQNQLRRLPAQPGCPPRNRRSRENVHLRGARPRKGHPGTQQTLQQLTRAKSVGRRFHREFRHGHPPGGPYQPDREQLEGEKKPSYMMASGSQLVPSIF